MLADFLDHSRTKRDQERDKQRRIIAVSYVEPIERAIESMNGEKAIRLGAVAATLARDPEFSLVPELGRAVERAVSENRTLAVLHHPYAVWTARLSRDGRAVLTSCSDGNVRVWDAHRAQELLVLKGHKDEVFGADFSPAGDRILSWGRDGRAILWHFWLNPSSYSSQFVLRCCSASQAAVFDAKFSPDGDFVATASRDGAHIWCANTGALLHRLSHDEQFAQRVTVSRCGRYVVVVYQREAIIYWAQTGTRIHALEKHPTTISEAAVLPDCQRVVTGSFDGSVRIFRIADGQLERALEGHLGRIYNLKSYDSHSAIVSTSGGADRSARLWRIDEDLASTVFAPHANSVSAAALSSDATKLLSSSYDGVVRLWDAETGALFLELRGHSSYVDDVCFGECGRVAVSASRDGTARIWDLRTSQQIGGLHSQYQSTARIHFASALSTASRRVLTLSAQNCLELVDLENGDTHSVMLDCAGPLQRAAISSDGSKVFAADIHSNIYAWNDAGTLLSGRARRNLMYDAYLSESGAYALVTRFFAITGEPSRVAVVDSESRSTISKLKLPILRVSDAVFSPMDEYVAVCLKDTDDTFKVAIFSAIDGRELTKLPHKFASQVTLKFSPCSRFLGIVPRQHRRNANALITCATTGRIISEVPLGRSSHYSDIVFSGDGESFTLLPERPKLPIRSVRTGKVLATLRSNVGPVWSAAFSTDGWLVATAAVDHSIKIWNRHTEALICELQGHAGEVKHLVFANDGVTLASWGEDDKVRIWDLSTLSARARIATPELLLAALGKGIGTVSASESEELLIREANRDLKTEFGDQLRAARNGSVPDVDKFFDAPAPHANCYLSPTQLSQAFKS